MRGSYPAMKLLTRSSRRTRVRASNHGEHLSIRDSQGCGGSTRVGNAPTRHSAWRSFAGGAEIKLVTQCIIPSEVRDKLPPMSEQHKLLVRERLQLPFCNIEDNKLLSRWFSKKLILVVKIVETAQIFRTQRGVGRTSLPSRHRSACSISSHPPLEGRWLEGNPATDRRMM